VLEDRWSWPRYGVGAKRSPGSGRLMAPPSHRLTRAAILFLAAAAFAAFGLAGPGSTPAQAAPCPVPAYGLGVGGNLSIQGSAPCDEAPEVIEPFCSGGTVWFDYQVNATDQGLINTSVPCGTPTHLSIYGHEGDDTLDLSRVSGAGGFTGIQQPNLIDGGYGNDTLVGSPSHNDLQGGEGNDIALARNGTSDAVACGDGIDAVQSDQAGVDTLSQCEIVDLAITPAVASTPAPVAVHTGRRAAALKKCKKRRHRRARRRCIRRAKRLPR
jgi:RTX calcium-binding nonapeptide repeat (4 copies)